MKVWLCAPLAMLAGSALAIAQSQGQPPVGGGTANPQTPAPTPPQQPGIQQPEMAPSTQTPDIRMPGSYRSYESRWTEPKRPTFQGFPVFPSQLSGYGGFPTAGGLPLSGLRSLPLVPAPDEPPGWPSWVRTSSKEPLPYAPELALLIRNADRVWQRAAADEPFVPMFFHDKLRTLQIGAAVEVRQNGEFELLLHKSTRMVARGPTALELLKLDPAEVRVRISNLTWMRIGVMEREHTFELPDGSTLHIATPPATVPAFLPMPIPMSTPLPGVTDVVIARKDEPEWLGGRATLSNLGSTDVRWQHASGEVIVPPSHRVTFFLQPPGHHLAAGLDVTGATVEKVETTRICRSPGGGRATWCGATFELPPGAAVQFDPQQGRPFEPAAAKAGVPAPAPR